jgi:magnesium and cobalt transporter
MMNTSSSPAKSWFQKLLQTLASHEPQDKEALITLLRDAEQRNLLATDTLAMIEGAIEIAEMHVRDIMIPRAQMSVLELDESPEQLAKIVVETGHSRFPVIGENRDDVQGILLAKDLLEYFISGTKNFNLRDIMRPAVFIPESKRLNVLLREFRTSRNHIAIVVDEYGGVAGLVTIEDVIEQIVGDIDDEYDVDDEIFIKSPDNQIYSVNALTPIEDFNTFFKTHFSDEEFDTIGGLVMQAFGHLPKKGEQLTLGKFHFEVSRADSRRIKMFKVIQLMDA